MNPFDGYDYYGADMASGYGMQPDSILSALSQPQQFSQAPQQPDIAREILSARFEPNSGDSSRAALGSVITGHYIDPVDTAMKRLQNAATIQRNVAAAQLNMQGGPGNATIKAAQQIMLENPGMTFSEAFSFAKSGLGQGMTYTPGVGVTTMQGAPEAAGNMAAGKEGGQKGVELGYAGPIAAAAAAGGVQGKGEITPIEQKGIGQNQVSKVVGDISGYYDELNAAGAAVNTANDPVTNFRNYMGNTRAGQLGGKMFGTNEQSIRNKIQQAIPNLINSIRQTTGMSAKAMDSNAELQFYLQQATDPTLDIAANKAALARIEQMYGTSAGGANSPQGSPVNLKPKQAAPARVIHFNDLPD